MLTAPHGLPLSCCSYPHPLWGKELCFEYDTISSSLRKSFTGTSDSLDGPILRAMFVEGPLALVVVEEVGDVWGHG